MINVQDLEFGIWNLKFETKINETTKAYRKRDN